MKLPSRKKKVEPVSESPVLDEDNSNGDISKLLKGMNADDLEKLIAVAKATGMVQDEPVGGRGAGRISQTEEGMIKLLDYVCRPKRGRDREVTYLNSLQATLLPAWEMLEAVVDPKNSADDLHRIYRESLYAHRRSVNRWFPMQLLALAGMQEEEKNFDRDIKGAGF